MYPLNCKHENLKYFEQTYKVICLDCGDIFYEDRPNIYPQIPIKYPEPVPNYPIYPTITWSELKKL